MSPSKDTEAELERKKTGDEDDLSDAASSRIEQQSLHGDELPSYEDAKPDSGHGKYPAEKSELPNEKIEETTAENTVGPTASAPFNFPTDEIPTLIAPKDIKRPFAIPQINPARTAPLLSAYPTDLIHYGIPPDSWYSFLKTTSAFLSANVSKQALHHAADVGNAMGDFQKQYANNVKQSVKAMGKSAKRFNPFGVVGGFIGLTVGAAGHIVGSIASAPLSAMRKPQTPRERALAYLATANLEWFHQRGLHALLCNTKELSTQIFNEQPETFLETAWTGETPAQQMDALGIWISQVQLDDTERPAPSSRMNEPGPSSSAGKRTETPQLQLSSSTLWLVLLQEKEKSLFKPGEAHEGTSSESTRLGTCSSKS